MGVVGLGLDYTCAHIIIQVEISSVNLLPIQADFVTEIRKVYKELYTLQCQWYWHCSCGYCMLRYCRQNLLSYGFLGYKV